MAKPYRHQNPNYDFLADIQKDRTPLEAPVQEYLASSIQRAYQSGAGNPGDLPFLTSPALRAELPRGAIPTTIAEAESLLLKSHYPQMLTIGSRLENTNVGMGDLISEMIAPTNPHTPGFRQSVLNWDPSRGSLFTHMTNSLVHAATSAIKGYTPLGMSMDAPAAASSPAARVNGPDPDRQMAEVDFSGVGAAYSMPSKQPWYSQLAQRARGLPGIPTPFYAPAGEGLFTVDEGGRTLINPNASTSPKVGPQVTVTAGDLTGYARTLDDYYTTPKEQRVIDFGRERQVRSVNKFLRGMNHQLQGGEFISTDAEVIGTANSGEGDWLRTHRASADDRVYIDADPPDYSGPTRTIGAATRAALDTFSSPTESLMKSAAEEAAIRGRLGANKIARWKAAVTAKELQIERAAGYYGFEWENPQMAKRQTLAWKNAKGAVERHLQTQESVIDYVDSDPSIPREYKQQAVDNLVERKFGAYGSQAEPAVPDPWEERAPHSDVGNVGRTLEEPASGATANLASMPAPEPAQASVREMTVRDAAMNGARFLLGNEGFITGYGDWIGKGKEAAVPFRRWLDEIGGRDALNAWDSLLADMKATRSGANSVWYDEVLSSRSAWREQYRQSRKNASADAEETSGGLAGSEAPSLLGGTATAQTTMRIPAEVRIEGPSPEGVDANAAFRDDGYMNLSDTGNTTASSSGSGGSGTVPPAVLEAERPKPNRPHWQVAQPPSPRPQPAAGGGGMQPPKGPPPPAAAAGEPPDDGFLDAVRRWNEARPGEENARHRINPDDPRWTPRRRSEFVRAMNHVPSPNTSHGTPEARAAAERSMDLHRALWARMGVRGYENYAPSSSGEEIAQRQQEFAENGARRVEDDSWSPADRQAAHIGDSLSQAGASLPQRMAVARHLMKGLGTEFLLGRRHEEYGEFTGSEFFNSKLEKTTIGRGLVGHAQRLYSNAVDQAFEDGGLEGLSNQEVAATIHKRVGQFINKSLDRYEQDLQATGMDSTSAGTVRQKVQAVTKMYGQEGDKFLSGLLGVNPKDGDYSSLRLRSDKDFREAMRDPDFAQRVKELGGEQAVRSGETRVISAGAQAYEVGGEADETYGEGGYKRGIKSIYSEPLGHFMMAQFMAQMAWKSTGGSVMEDARGWATGQYGYLGLERFGGGEASSAAMARSRQELAANFTGRLAYEQYGMFSELGYVASNLPGGDNLVRGVNDVKMGLGTAAVAGIGTWGVGALVGSTALTAAALPVGLAVGGAVLGPSLAMTAMNMATGQDSYSGYSWKNMLAGAAMQVAQRGRPRDDYGPAGNFMNGVFSHALAFAPGETQEAFSHNVYGESRRDLVAGSWVGEAIGVANVNWLYEGSDEKSKDLRSLSEEVMRSTGLTEEEVFRGLSGLQVAFGGLDTKERRQAAQLVMNRASEYGMEASSILAGASSLASQRGIYEGTAQYIELARTYAGLTPVEQQMELTRSSRAYQKYAQWTPYMEGGTAAAYALYDQLGGASMAQTQSIQQVFAQAQMMGVNVTDSMARSLASTVGQFEPWMGMDLTRTASSLSEMGVGSFPSVITGLSNALSSPSFRFDGSNIVSGVGNQADTWNFIKGVTSGNQYALSDYGRMADIGALQVFDTQGLQAGLKDMSGLLSFARQNILRMPGLTGAQTLAGLGMKFEYTSQSALLEGGLWGYQDSVISQLNGLQEASIGVGFAQAAAQKQFLWGGGSPTAPASGSAWDLENQVNRIQWQSQLRNFDYQRESLQLRHDFQRENEDDQRQQMYLSNDYQLWAMGFNYQTSLMQRDWAREDWDYSAGMRSMQYGWSMEDVNEQIRRSSGYERSMLIKQRDRMVTSNQMEEGQVDRQQERQEELWAREDERYEKQLEYTEQMQQMEEDRFERTREQNEALFLLQMEHLNDEERTAVKLHALRMEMEELQRKHQAQQISFQEASLGIQYQQLKVQNEYQDNMRKTHQTQQEQEATVRKIVQYQPAFSRLLNDFYNFLVKTQRLEVPQTRSSGNPDWRSGVAP